MRLSAHQRVGMLALGGVALATLAVYFAFQATQFGSEETARVFSVGVYNGLLAVAALSCFLRAAFVETERAAWLVMGFALTAWAAGDLYYSLALENLEDPPYPSLADIGYLGLYAAIYVAVVILVRARIARLPRSLWLDGAIAALAVAALASALILQPIVDATEGDTAAVATTLAYPLADLLLLGCVVAVFAVCGWRPGRTWLLLGAGLLTLVVTDVIYLVQVAKGTYTGTTVLDAFWPTAALLIGLSAWQPSPARAVPRIEGLRVVLLPMTCSLTALGLMAYDHFERVNIATLLLTFATLLLVIVRLAITFLDNQRMLVASRHEATTDGLTGLRNRRALMRDIKEDMENATPTEPLAVLLFDLNGFKQYNDSFGHPAGDALLARLGGRLGEAVEPWGRAYRLGGDEFCAVVRPGGMTLDSVIGVAVGSLAESGEGFDVTSAYGLVEVPRETTEPEEALRLADTRMYAQKGGRATSVTRQTRDVLLRTLREQQPELREHLQDVADMAVAVGRELDMGHEELDELARAAELHDIGKVAIPDTILSKPGPLDDAEWAFMRRHTVIGERILSAAPALRPVAALVRSSHERWDGGGYPDGLAGEEIPLGARVVAVCDAFEAMVAQRPYRQPMSQDDAITELRRCAGSQFDPQVVELLVQTLERQSGATEAVS